METNNYEPMSTLHDLSDGVKLIQLMVSEEQLTASGGALISIDGPPSGNYGQASRCGLQETSPSYDITFAFLGDVSLGRYNKNPRMRVQKAENVNKALEFITSRGVKLTNIGPEGELTRLHVPLSQSSLML